MPYRDKREKLTHSEHYSLRESNWDYFITIRPEADSSSIARRTENGEIMREKFVRRFMNFLRAGLKLREREMFWVGTSEQEGFGKVPHMHILLELRSKRAISESEIQKAVRLCLERMMPTSGPLNHRTDSVGNAEEDRCRVASYFAKHDGIRHDKSFWFSTWFDAKFR